MSLKRTASLTPARAYTAKPQAEAKKPSDPTPQLVKRVHELYEQLGREEVRAVQGWEKAQGD